MSSQLPLFWCLFLSYQLQKNPTKNGAAVTSLRSFLFRDDFSDYLIGTETVTVGWSKNPVSSQTDILMAGTKFSDYLGLNHYKKAKKN